MPLFLRLSTRLGAKKTARHVLRRGNTERPERKAPKDQRELAMVIGEFRGFLYFAVGGIQEIFGFFGVASEAVFIFALSLV